MITNYYWTMFNKFIIRSLNMVFTIVYYLFAVGNIFSREDINQRL